MHTVFFKKYRCLIVSCSFNCAILSDPKLVIPVHVSMEEPVLKTKAERSTSVNAVVDGKETIAKKI